MKTAALFITVAIAVGVATPASAQDSAAISTFTGPRIEGQFGYEFVSAGPRNIQDFQGRGQFGEDSIDENVFYGVEAGYDVQVGNLVVGAYAGLDNSDAEVQSAAAPLQFRVGRQFTAGLRVGGEVRGVLLYGKGGYSNGTLIEIVRTNSDAVLFTDYDRNRNGLHFGAGFEVPVLENFYSRLDYSYHEYEKFRIGTTRELDFSRHRLAAGIGIRF